MKLNLHLRTSRNVHFSSRHVTDLLWHRSRSLHTRRPRQDLANRAAVSLRETCFVIRTVEDINAYGRLLHTPPRTCDFIDIGDVCVVFIDGSITKTVISNLYRRATVASLRPSTGGPPGPQLRLRACSLLVWSRLDATHGIMCYVRSSRVVRLVRSLSFGLIEVKSEVKVREPWVSDFREHSGPLSQRVDRDQPHRSLNAGTSILFEFVDIQ